jgi:hypothetical protein
MKTLLLDTVEWDLVLDVTRNIAVASDPYSLAQDAASAIRLFLGELYYDTTQGVPYWSTILGKRPPVSLIKTYLIRAALTVPGVTSAQVFLTSITDRSVNGQVQISTESGVTATAAF